MKRIVLVSLLSIVLLWGCGEAGLETDISKVNTIVFSVSDLTAEGYHVEWASVNLAEEEFADYLGDIEQFKVNKIEIEIVNVVAAKAFIGPAGGFRAGGLVVTLGSGELLEVVYEGGTGTGTTGNELFHDGQGNLGTQGRVKIYDEVNPSSVQVPTSQNAINILISALENRSKLDATIEMNGAFENATFDVKIYLDLTARAQLN